MSKPSAIGAYIFAGGFTIGVKKHFDVDCHLEESGYGVPTVKRNWPDFPVHHPPENWPLQRLKKSEWDFVYGNPPCAAWSQAGKVVFGGDWRTDPRIFCARKHFGLLEELRPSFWAWESVPRAFSAGRELVDEFTERAVKMDYSVTYLLHNAMYLGLAQNRPRFFFVAHRYKFDVPRVSFAPLNCGELLRKMNYIGEIDLHFPEHLARLIPSLRPGKQLRECWEEANPAEGREKNHLGQIKGRPSFAEGYRLDPDKPSNTIAGFRLVHPSEDRLLTTREMAALCGFPADYEFVGTPTAIRALIARGVCPPVGEWLAGMVAEGVRKKKPTSGIVRLVDFRQPPEMRAEWRFGRPAPTAIQEPAYGFI
jgi:DNA (cytosine-5)-methyltransferase 1